MKMVYVACPSQEVAEKLAAHCLESGLIACANMLPATSMYKEEGKVSRTQETLLIAKTMPEHALVLVDEIKKIHTYAIPCIIEFDAQATQDYRDWMISQLCKL